MNCCCFLIAAFEVFFMNKFYLTIFSFDSPLYNVLYAVSYN